MQTNQVLKRKVLRGGIYLMIRQIVGSVLALLSVLVIARILGPERYGIVAITVGTLYFVFEIAKLGLDVYVIREPNLPDDGPEQVLTLYNLIGLSLCGVLWLGIAIVSFVTGFTVILQTMSCLVPIVWVAMVGNLHTAMLERNMRFAEIGWIDAISQIVGAVVSIVLVLTGWGYWGPIAGQALLFVTRTALSMAKYPIRWNLHLQRAFLKSAFHYCLMYVASNWIFALKSITIPLFVGPLVGLNAVGILNIAIRFVDQIGTFRLVAFRLSLSAVSKMPDLETIRSAISRGMVYQGLLVGPLYVLFSCCGSLVIPIVFGEEWLPSISVFPYIAFGFFIYTFFTMHCSSLYTASRSADVAKFHLWNIGLLWVGTFCLSSRFGLWGYPIAELIALPSYISLHRSITQFCGSPAYQDGIWLVVATTPALLAGPLLPPVVGLAIFVLSYALLFIFRSSIRKIPLDVIAALKARDIRAST